MAPIRAHSEIKLQKRRGAQLLPGRDAGKQTRAKRVGPTGGGGEIPCRTRVAQMFSPSPLSTGRCQSLQEAKCRVERVGCKEDGTPDDYMVGSGAECLGGG